MKRKSDSKEKIDAQAARFSKMLKITKSELRRRSAQHDHHYIEFGTTKPSETNDNEMAEEELYSTHQPRPMMIVLQEMIRAKDPRIVFTSAVAEAETDYESLVHHGDEYRVSSLLPEAKAKLWPYQEEAVRFLGNRERDTANVGCKGVMLCDEMGLGKTLETLTYIYRDLQQRQRETGRRFNGVTLIVIPGVLLDVWVSEIEASFPPNSIHYLKMMGDKNPVPDRMHIENCTDIIFTTYTVVSLVYTALFTQSKADGEEDEIEVIGEKAPVENAVILAHRYHVLFDIQFRRVVLDEAHYVANYNTSRYRAMKRLAAHSKWMNTGTPIQNSYKNIYACFDFIGVPIDDRLAHVLNSVGLNTNITEQDELHVKNLLNKVMIRRLKHQINMGVDKPLFLLTEVDKKIVLVDFATHQERILYLMYAAHGLSKMKGTNITTAIQMMRQCCIDFHIMRDPVIPNGMLLGQNASLMKTCHTPFNEKLFYEDSRSYLRPKKKGAEEATDLIKRAYKHNRETTYQYHQNDADQGDGLIYQWNPYKCDSPHIDLENDELSRQLYRTTYNLMRDEALDDLESIRERIYAAMHINENDEDEPQLRLQIEAVYHHLMARVLPRFSTKQRYAIDYLRKIEDPTDKVIISSDSVCFLRSMAECLTAHNYKSCIFTGESSKKSNDSKNQLSQFESDPTIRVILSSMKKGGVGLNMQCANHVLSFSLWWNPHGELQAESRVHRIGQTKQVYIRYFIMRDTMEEYILGLSAYKKNISCQLIEKQGDDIAIEPSEDEVRKRLFGFKLKCTHQK